jgi:threonylcarbamoyladenosine tRNA methylthiotransferase MtaB
VTKPESRVKVAVLTLGCRVNQSESSAVEGTLRQHGISVVSLDERPDYCVINTCTVTGKSDANSRQLIRKASRTGAKVIVTGCYSELKRDDVVAMDGVSHVITARDKDKIVGIIIGQETGMHYHIHDRARPYLKVQDGCNFSCSYCAVPLARGRSRSLPPETAVERVKSIQSQGYQEVVLTGIHLGSYGKDLSDKYSLARLLKKILSQTEIPRVRLSSLEINELDDELLELLADARVCRHLHLPLQSGSDVILRKMNRTYTAETYRKKMLAIAKRFGDIAIGSDIIVGFPGEDQKAYLDTRDMIQEMPFAYLHIFPYSPRPGTTASTMLPAIPINRILERARSLKQLASAKKEEYALKHLNKTLDVIIEERDGDDHMTGTASNYLKIRVPAITLKRGSMVVVRSAGIDGTGLKGYVIA